MISQQALSLLSSAAINANRVEKLPEMSRPLYEEVNEVLTRLGGKWKGGKTQAHVFSYDPSPLLQAVISTGEMPPKNPLDFYRSTPIVLDKIKEIIDAEVKPDEVIRILEPSAGDGAIAQLIAQLFPGSHIDMVEMDSFRAGLLRQLGIGQVYEADFLTWEPPTPLPYDLVVANPPFNSDDTKNVWVEHLQRMYHFVGVNKMVISVVPAGIRFSSIKKVSDLRAWVEARGQIIDLSEKAFEDSGTGIRACLVAVRISEYDSARQDDMVDSRLLSQLLTANPSKIKSLVDQAEAEADDDLEKLKQVESTLVHASEQADSKTLKGRLDGALKRTRRTIKNVAMVAERTEMEHLRRRMLQSQIEPLIQDESFMLAELVGSKANDDKLKEAYDQIIPHIQGRHELEGEWFEFDANGNFSSSLTWQGELKNCRDKTRHHPLFHELREIFDISHDVPADTVEVIRTSFKAAKAEANLARMMHDLYTDSQEQIASAYYGSLPLYPCYQILKAIADDWGNNTITAVAKADIEAAIADAQPFLLNNDPT